jgi:hypothetical protein
LNLVHRSILSDTGSLRLARQIAAIAVFGFVGPPVGGLVAWAMMGAAGGHSPVPFVAGSYGEALLIALATGAIVAIAAWFGRASWIVAVAAALLANAAFHVATLNPSVPDRGAALMDVAYVFFPPSIVAALVCLWLTRRLVAR